MRPQRFADLVAFTRPGVRELFPWDLREELDAGRDLLLVDIREPYEYGAMHVSGSRNVPRGILELACDWGYEETVPELAAARARDIVLLCRSGNRTILAADVMQRMGFTAVRSLRTGLRGWNDYEQPLVDAAGAPVTLDAADDYFAPRISADQVGP
ncbi:MAG: rhodanese-like domain-containing protein [Gammaproteobacteria bacterium]|nr:rhodanese-like domain-containing protein [Gammaproteobacteria bacterium]